MRAIKTILHCLLWGSGTFEKSQLSEPIDVPSPCLCTNITDFSFHNHLILLIISLLFITGCNEVGPR